MTNQNQSFPVDHTEILEQVGVAVITINSSGVILQTNQSACAMFGYDRQGLIGKALTLLMPHNHAAKHDAYIRHHLTTGERRIIGTGRRVEGRRADGANFPMHIAVGRLDVDGEVYFQGIIHDLSVENQFQSQVQRLGSIVDKSVNEVFLFDTQTLKFTLVNKGAQSNLGYSLDELSCMTPVDIKPRFSEAEFRSLLEPLISGELERINFQTVHQRKDGSIYDAEIFLHLTDDDVPTEFMAIVQDRTEQNNLIKAVGQAQKMESIGQLTGGIAHDFNNLLTVITGNLELMEMALTDTDLMELLTDAKNASERGADLTHRLLSFARKSSLSPKPVNLNEVVVELVELMKRSLSERVSVELTLATELWIVNADRSQIDSALMNLAINARDAMAGHGRLSIETRNVVLSATEAEMLNLVSGHYALLSVTDTGVGIPQDNIDSVFEPFFTTKSKSQGHGLGLSMVYGFAHQSGGSVTVDSSPGDGARFSLYLPRDRSIDAEHEAETIPATQAVKRNAKILLVEDDDSVRRLTVRRLNFMGHSVYQARDTVEGAVIFADEKDVDLLITDVVMPGELDGFEFAKQIREQKRNLPIILSSGYSEALTSQKELMADGYYWLPKPYTMSALQTMVSEALED